MDLTLAECAQLGETITGRPSMDNSTNWLPTVTISWRHSARPATTFSTSKWGARQSTTSAQSAKPLCGWTVLRWSSPKPQWLSTAGCKFISEESPTCIPETLYILYIFLLCGIVLLTKHSKLKHCRKSWAWMTVFNFWEVIWQTTEMNFFPILVLIFCWYQNYMPSLSIICQCVSVSSLQLDIFRN